MSHKDTLGDYGDTHADLMVKTHNKVERPSRYKVIMLNDDYTPMDFVIQILQMVFKKTSEEAEAIMLTVHKEGAAVCGVYPYEVAETKALQVVDHARKEEHPLQCRIEKEA